MSDSTEPEATGLEFFTTDQLSEELAKRFSALVIAGVHSLDPNREEFFLDYRGGLTTCIGLARRSAARLTKTALDCPREED